MKLVLVKTRQTLSQVPPHGKQSERGHLNPFYDSQRASVLGFFALGHAGR